MTAVRLLSPGGSYSMVAATGDVFTSSMPPLYASVDRVRPLRYEWRVTTGSRVLASGEAYTSAGAWRAAHRASQRPDIARGDA